MVDPVDFLEYPANNFVRAILSYPNVHLKYFEVGQISKKTPIENWIKYTKMFRSMFVNVHVADVFRFVMLWRYQGIYLDLDTLVLKNLDDMPKNFACIENDEHSQMGNAFLGFEGEVGKNVVKKCLQ